MLPNEAERILSLRILAIGGLHEWNSVSIDANQERNRTAADWAVLDKALPVPGADVKSDIVQLAAVWAVVGEIILGLQRGTSAGLMEAPTSTAAGSTVESLPIA